MSLITAAVAVDRGPTVEVQLHVFRDGVPAPELRALVAEVRDVVASIAADLGGA